MKPHYQHDCDQCVWLGSITFPAPLSTGQAPLTNADLYYCERCDGGTVIARFSSKGSNYASCPVNIIEQSYLPRLAVHNQMSTACPALIVGYLFGIAKKLITKPSGANT